jgi:hypothetical protein
MKSIRALVSLSLLACIFLTACAPPMKMRTRVKPVVGDELGAEPVTGVIRPGVTTRAEILRQFASFDTGWKGERLFLGRWLLSGFSNNAERYWHGRNLVVEFDEKAVVIRYMVLSDKEFLDGKDSWLLTSEKDQPGFEQPIKTEVCTKPLRPGNQQPACGTRVEILSVGGKNFIVLGQIVFPNYLEYRIAPEQIERLSAHTYMASYGSYPSSPFTSDFVLYMHLKEKIYADGKEHKKFYADRTLMVDTDMPTVLLLVRFLHKSAAHQQPVKPFSHRYRNRDCCSPVADFTAAGNLPDSQASASDGASLVRRVVCVTLGSRGEDFDVHERVEPESRGRV